MVRMMVAALIVEHHPKTDGLNRWMLKGEESVGLRISGLALVREKKGSQAHTHRIDDRSLIFPTLSTEACVVFGQSCQF